jgi:hypothetical protein
MATLSTMSPALQDLSSASTVMIRPREDVVSAVLSTDAGSTNADSLGSVQDAGSKKVDALGSVRGQAPLVRDIRLIELSTTAPRKPGTKGPGKSCNDATGIFLSGPPAKSAEHICTGLFCGSERQDVGGSEMHEGGETWLSNSSVEVAARLRSKELVEVPLKLADESNVVEAPPVEVPPAV